MKERRQRRTLTDELKGHGAIHERESAILERESSRAARRTHQDDYGDISDILQMHSSTVPGWELEQGARTDELTRGET